MTKDEWQKFMRDRREEALLLPHRATIILFEVILKLGEIIFDTETPPMLVGPCSPREARDAIEGEAIALTDHENQYCGASWKDNARLICTRPIHFSHDSGDHAVGHGGMIVARWPATQCSARWNDKKADPDVEGRQCILNEHDKTITHRFK